jgi:negative regulator of flagellin synthesis FlgM
MTDAIFNSSRLAQLDSLSRQSLDKKGKADETVSATAPPSESEIAARKAAAAAQDAPSVGFAEVQQRLKQEPDFDRAKVDAIKHAIQNGQYPLNPRRIAESFVALEQLISD